MQLLIQKVHTISLHNSILRSHSFGISQFRLRIQTAVADFLFPSHSCTRAKKESGRIGPKPSVRLHKKWRKCLKKVIVSPDGTRRTQVGGIELRGLCFTAEELLSSRMCCLKHCCWRLDWRNMWARERNLTLLPGSRKNVFYVWEEISM